MVADLSFHILPSSIGDTACDVSAAKCRGLEQTHSFFFAISEIIRIFALDFD